MNLINVLLRTFKASPNETRNVTHGRGDQRRVSMPDRGTLARGN